MAYEERIARLHEQGVLTQEQAKRLANSLSERPRDEGDPRRPIGRYLFWTVATVLLVLVLYVSVGTDSGPPQIQDVRTSLNQPQEIGDMGKALTGGVSVALFLGVPLLALLIWFTWIYNNLVTREEDVLKAWAQVESNYQRRADLIPNILETVQKYMRFEKETLTGVVGERAEATAGRESFGERDAAAFRATVEEISKAQEDSAAELKGIVGAPHDEEQLARLYAAQQKLGSAMHRILAISENYPVLRSADQMLTLQAELEGSENRINVARMRFNEAAAEFNASIRRMPASLVASTGDFKRKAYFQADTGANKAVTVKFE
jgi:LemA protein